MYEVIHVQSLVAHYVVVLVSYLAIAVGLSGWGELPVEYGVPYRVGAEGHLSHPEIAANRKAIEVCAGSKRD